MAGRTRGIRGTQGVTAIRDRVALVASIDLSCRRHLMRVGQRKAGGAVIKLAIGPGGDGVTLGASRGGGREV